MGPVIMVLRSVSASKDVIGDLQKFAYMKIRGGATVFPLGGQKQGRIMGMAHLLVFLSEGGVHFWEGHCPLCLCSP